MELISVILLSYLTPSLDTSFSKDYGKILKAISKVSLSRDFSYFFLVTLKKIGVYVNYCIDVCYTFTEVI